MIAPELSSQDRIKLRRLNPHFEAKWNRRFERWEIWFNDHIRMPYIVANARVFDVRIFNELRHALWFSQAIRRNVYRMQEKFQEMNQMKLKKEENLHQDLGKEIAPLLRTLKDAGTSSHGRSKTKFSGVDFGGAK